VRLEPRVRRDSTRHGVRERYGGGILSNRTEGQDRFYAAEMLSKGVAQASVARIRPDTSIQAPLGATSAQRRLRELRAGLAPLQ
jgi:hypothetical protein